MNQHLQRAVSLTVLMLVPWVLVVAQTALEPLSLDDAIEFYLERNLEIEAARLEVELVRADVIGAGLRPNPEISVTAENFKLGGDAPFSNLYEIAASYSETIELGGKRRFRTQVADLGVSVAEARLADTLRRGISQVERFYYEAVLATGQLAIATEDRDAFDELVRYNQVRFDEGAVSEADLIKVRLERVQFERTVRQAELARDQAAIRLAERFGESNYGRFIADDDMGFTPMPHPVETLKMMAMDARPDVRAGGLELALAQERTGLAKANGSVDLTPFVGYRRVAANDTVLFGVSIPLPFRDRNQGGVARAAAGESIAEAQLGAIRNRTLAEVESAYRGWEAARDQVLVFQNELLDQADRSYSIATIAYQEGATELLPLLEAQRTRTFVRDQFLQSLFDYQSSIIDLELAVGRDVQ
jgi:cobalt-zinc-cadmium efflux system outer membrane protein